MRIAIVANELEGERTGVGRYLAGLLSGLAEVMPPDWRLGLFFQGPPEDPVVGELQRGGSRIEAIHPRRRALRRTALWEQTQLPRELGRWRAGLVFSPSYSLPPTGGVPGMVTVHDLSFELLPEEFGWRERWRRRLLARRACARAARVLTDTRAMRRQVAERYALDPRRIGVVPLAVEGRFRPAAAGQPPADRAALAALGVRPPYLLYLGALLDRRQPELMLDAFRDLAADHPDLALVIAGPDRRRRGWAVEERVGELGLAGRVKRLGYVGEAAVPALLRGAEATLYLSSYEGYGLPPLESLACGTPAVVGPGLALDELWPDYPYRVSALELAPATAVLRRLLAAPAEAAETVRRQGIDTVGGLSWRRSAERWIEEAREALGR